MVSRRTLLKFGTAGVAAAVTQASAHSIGSTLFGAPRELVRAVFDERHAEGRAFAAVFNVRGLPTSAIRGDVAALWYQDLKLELVRQKRPLVGLTGRASLFCLEELARDVGMKVQGRIDHSCDPSGVITHQVTGPSAWLSAGRRLGPGQGFGRTMATLLIDPTVHGDSFAAQKHTGPFSAPIHTTLVSWWIA